MQHLFNIGTSLLYNCDVIACFDIQVLTCHIEWVPYAVRVFGISEGIQPYPVCVKDLFQMEKSR